MRDIMIILLLLGLAAVCKTSPEIDCKNPTTFNGNHIIKCCKYPTNDNDLYFACAQEAGFQMPGSAEESTLTNMEPGERIIAGTCFSKCVFDKLKFLKDDQLDMEGVRNHYTTVYKSDPEFAQAMIDNFDKCHGKSQDDMAKRMSSMTFVNTTKNICYPLPTAIWSCVYVKYFQNCPTNHWTNTEECNTALEFSKSCPSKLPAK